MEESRIIATFRALCERNIQFIVVGGLAAVLNGAPVHTYDIDLVYSREQANVDPLLLFLREHPNLLTAYVPVDLIATVGANLSFSDLLPLSEKMDIGEGLRIQVLNLETVISIKEQLASDKDLAVLPILRQTLREMRKPGNG